MMQNQARTEKSNTYILPLGCHSFRQLVICEEHYTVCMTTLKHCTAKIGKIKHKVTPSPMTFLFCEVGVAASVVETELQMKLHA